MGPITPPRQVLIKYIEHSTIRRRPLYFAHTHDSRRRRLTTHSSSLTANATAHTSFAVRTQRLTVLCFTTFLLVLQEPIWRTKWTPKSRKRHPLGRHSVRVQVTGHGAFALPRPAADQRTRFSMIISNDIETS